LEAVKFPPKEEVSELIAQLAVPNKDPVNPDVALTEPVITVLFSDIIPFLATNSFGIYIVP
jgi:hypothetical protein